MRYLTLLLAIIIAGCSSPNAPVEEEKEDSFQEYRIGNWLVKSDNLAEYAGVKGKLKADSTSVDTIDIYQPNGIYMEMEYTGRDQYFMLTITDSTVTIKDKLHPFISFEGVSKNERLLSGNVNRYQSDPYGGLIKSEMRVKCNHLDIGMREYFYLGYSVEKFDYQNPELVYKIAVDGMVDTAIELACQSS